MAWRIFYSYSHKDDDLRERLGTYLAPLKQQQRITEWHDRRIEPGANWDKEISAQLDSADLILLLVTADFLASEYCFGVEIERAMERLKRGAVKVVPILFKPCLWEESRFSDLQIIPRDAKPITSWPSIDEALKDVASELRTLVSGPRPVAEASAVAALEPHRFDRSLDLVRSQIRAYAKLYEKTRQRMRPGADRTHRMEQVFQKMRGIATASYPLLDELVGSPSPGERLAGVAILQTFAAEQYLSFLVGLIASEKPFVGYHAVKGLRFAVGAIDSSGYPELANAIREAQVALQSASVGFDADRQTELRAADEELRQTIAALAAASESHD
jgi:hypothetical protein